MCGIFGWITAKKHCPGLSKLEELTALLAHRGPDGKGAYIHASRDGETSIGLGHRRLSIVDLTVASSQPMWSKDGRYCLVYNGEIYNYIELRQEIEQYGFKIYSSGDTEVLLAALMLWGEAALPKLRGMFAFALLDTKNETVLFARDPYGKKPLFFGVSGRDFYFSSEILPITKVPGFDCAFDRESLNGYLLDRYVSSPRTFFKNITKLRPGSYALWEKGTLRQERYYSPQLAQREPELQDYREALRLFDQLLDEAVRIRMRSDVPVGAFLSGGVDSSAVVAHMRRHSSNTIKTFSVNFTEADYSEGEFARAAAQLYETEHHELTVSSRDFFANWDDAILHRGAPVSEASDIPLLILSKLARESVTVVLTGEGADEFFAGYPKYIAEGYSALYRKMVPSSLHQSLVSPLVDKLPYGMRRAKILAKAFGERDIASRMRVWFGGLTPHECENLLPGWHGREDEDLGANAAGKSEIRQLMLFDQLFWLPDNTLERADRMLMAHSIEGRMPFMDTELSALAARFPDRFLIHGRHGKRVLRDALRNILPEGTLERSKNGFRVPIHSWFKNDHADDIRELLLSNESRVRTLLDRQALDRIVHEHLSGVANQERVLWSLCNLERFIRVYKLDVSSG